jgi:hypothetical protein
LPGQKFGNQALGAIVTRHFPDEGNFTATIIAFRKMGTTNVYTVQYTDGDVEDLDADDYNVAYDLFLRESGWQPESFDCP